jgi:hypothetical protein
MAAAQLRTVVSANINARIARYCLGDEIFEALRRQYDTTRATDKVKTYTDFIDMRLRGDETATKFIARFENTVQEIETSQATIPIAQKNAVFRRAVAGELPDIRNAFIAFQDCGNTEETTYTYLKQYAEANIGRRRTQGDASREKAIYCYYLRQAGPPSTRLQRVEAR